MKPNISITFIKDLNISSLHTSYFYNPLVGDKTNFTTLSFVVDWVTISIFHSPNKYEPNFLHY